MNDVECGDSLCVDRAGVPTETAVLRRYWIEHNKGLLVRSGRSYSVGEVIRIPHYETAGGFRVWKVVGVHLGGEKQEGTYHLRPLDVKDNAEIHVPCIVLETHPEIELV